MSTKRQPDPLDYWMFASVMVLCWGPLGWLALGNLGRPQ